MAVKRIADEPAFVLHRYDWSESSLILEVFTRHHGRIALIAKGAKRPSSSFRPVLLPLQRLHLAFGGDAEIRTLKSAEWQGGHVMPTGEALLSGYYLNELLLTLLARDDPHPVLFDVYASVVAVLASAHEEVLEAALRSYELLLLREVGLLPQLDAQVGLRTAAGDCDGWAEHAVQHRKCTKLCARSVCRCALARAPRTTCTRAPEVRRDRTVSRAWRTGRSSPQQAHRQVTQRPPALASRLSRAKHQLVCRTASLSTPHRGASRLPAPNARAGGSTRAWFGMGASGARWRSSNCATASAFMPARK